VPERHQDRPTVHNFRMDAATAVCVRGGRTMSLHVQVFRCRHCKTIHALGRPASEKRQGTKSRWAGHRQCSGLYGELASGCGAGRFDRSGRAGPFGSNVGCARGGERVALGVVARRPSARSAPGWKNVLIFPRAAALGIGWRPAAVLGSRFSGADSRAGFAARERTSVRPGR
jgi:hypothetical protein